MKLLYKSILFPLALLSPADAGTIFIGTGGGDSKGIYQAEFSERTGKLGTPELAAEYRNPGFLVLHPTKPILYCIGQPKIPLDDGNGSVAAFAISADRKLTFLGESSSGGKGPCHIAIDATGETLAVANYGDGRIATVRLDEKGAPDRLITVISNTGSGPNKSRQDGPHAHGVYFDKANKHLFVPDLGLDKVLVYRFDEATSKLTEPLEPFSSKPGAGPRHLVFSADEKNAYIINELDQTVTTAAYDAETAKFTTVGNITTLPEEFTGTNKTAEIEVHPEGRYVYGSNRGHDSIAVLKRDGTNGDLSTIMHAPSGGKAPRHFKIDPSGNWLLSAHQDSNNISVLPLDPESGMLGPVANTVSTPSPICILFAR